MTWILAAVILIGVGYWLKRRVFSGVDRTAAETAATIEAFLDGTGGQWDWDDLTSIPIKDSKLDTIRQRCLDIYDEYPAGPEGGYCSEDGKRALKAIAEKLRAMKPREQT